MDASVRRAALRATAKVALAMTVVGCFGEVRVDSAAAGEGAGGDPSDPGSGGATSSPEPGSGGATSSPEPEELACQAPYPEEAVELDDGQLGCCEELLGPLVPTAGADWETWQEVAGALEVQGCCRVAVAHYEADLAGSEVSWEVLGPCCDALGFPAGPACTPWGPPVPPAVYGELPQWEVA